MREPQEAPVDKNASGTVSETLNNFKPRPSKNEADIFCE